MIKVVHTTSLGLVITKFNSAVEAIEYAREFGGDVRIDPTNSPDEEQPITVTSERRLVDDPEVMSPLSSRAVSAAAIAFMLAFSAFMGITVFKSISVANDVAKAYQSKR